MVRKEGAIVERKKRKNIKKKNDEDALLNRCDRYRDNKLTREQHLKLCVNLFMTS